MPLVLDASTSLAWAFADESFVFALPATQVQMSYAAAPALLFYEIASGLRKARKDLRLSQQQSERFLADDAMLEIRIDPEPPSVLRLLALAEEFGLSIYDAAYLDLALRSDLALATLDSALARAARKAGVALSLEV